MNPDEKIIIESYCQERCYGELAFIWRLFWFDSIDTPEPFRLTDLNQVSDQRTQDLKLDKAPIAAIHKLLIHKHCQLDKYL